VSRLIRKDAATPLSVTLVEQYGAPLEDIILGSFQILDPQVKVELVLSWALARSPGPRRLAWARLAAFCDSGLFRPLYGVRMWSPAPR
jgi:hypothetical protein